MQKGQQHVRYMEIMHKLQQSTGTCTCGGTGICTCSSTCIGAGSGIGIGTCVGAHDVDYCLTTDVLARFRDRIYVPNSSELKKVILREFHAKPYSGHTGYHNTLTAVKKFYYFLNLKKDVATFVARCFNYQCVKEDCKHPGGLLQPIVIPEWKWEVISMEFITGLSRTVRQHDSIMVVVDRLTKVVHFIPLKSTFSACDVTQVFIRDVVRLLGVPKNIVSDRDAKFTSKFWKELFAGLGIEFTFITT